MSSQKIVGSVKNLDIDKIKLIGYIYCKHTQDDETKNELWNLLNSLNDKLCSKENVR